MNTRLDRGSIAQVCWAFFGILLVACTPTPSADVGATVRAAVAATQTAQPTPTWTSTPQPTATPTTTSTVTPTATATPTPTPAVVDTPRPGTPPSGPYAVVGVTPDDSLSVRAGAGVDRAIVGTIPFYGIGVQVMGEGMQVGQGRWVPIQYGQVSGWVNEYFLARQVGWVDENVAARAAQIIWAIHERDLGQLAGFVHPVQGVRFSPYAYVRADATDEADRDRVFDAAEIRRFFEDQTVYRWGQFDGTGEPIDRTPEAYWERFVYDVDFVRPDVVGYDEFVGSGNTINNISQAYPQAVTVEYHFAGFDPQVGGLDWRSLRLVLEPYERSWYLVGIVHAEWTI